MAQINKHILSHNQPVKAALEQLNNLGSSLTLFVVNQDNQLIGTFTDGDFRRGALRGLTIEHPLSEFINKNFTYIQKNKYNVHQISEIRARGIKILPLLDSEMRLLNIYNLSEKRSILPIDAVVMAGGRGERLKPLTDTVPKPMLKIGDKPIIEHNIDRLSWYGIENIAITLRYLGHQISDYFDNGNDKGLRISYFTENQPLGTVGATRLLQHFEHDYVLLMNSDLLTNIDFEDFFKHFIEKEADFAVATIPYYVDIPYAVLETNKHKVASFKEKPTFTYYSSAGIYLFKKELIERIPLNQPYNATDLMEDLIQSGLNVVHYQILGYWLDIGKHNDFIKAQEDIKHIKL